MDKPAAVVGRPRNHQGVEVIHSESALLATAPPRVAAGRTTPPVHPLVPAERHAVMYAVAAVAISVLAGLGIAVAGAASLLWPDRVLDSHLYLAYTGIGLTFNGWLGHSAGLLVATAVALVLAAWALGTERGAILFALAPCAAVLASEVIKHVVARPDGLKPVHGFPSGHEAGLVALSAVALVLIRRGGPLHATIGWLGRVIIWLVALGAPIGFGGLLIAMRWHQPTDVFGGAALGLAAVFALAPVIDRLALARERS